MGKINLFFIFIFFQFFISTTLYGQNFNLTLIRTDKLTYETRDLWNLILQNISQESTSVYLQAYITDQQKGRAFEVRSADFILRPGVTQFNTSNYSQLLPEQVLFQKQNFKDHVVRTSSFPNGEYEICVFLFDSKTTKNLARDCYDIIQLNTTPPYLVSPYDEDTVREQFPFFVWSPPAPQPSNTKVSYALSVYEIYPQQTFISATQTNPEWFFGEDIQTPIYQYGLDLRPMIPGRRYSWFITAFVNGFEASSSEIWWFVYQPQEILEDEVIASKKKKRKPGMVYYELSNRPNVDWYSTYKNELNFIFINHNAVNKVPFRIIDYQGNIMHYNQIQVDYGYNFITIDLTELKDIKTESYLTLEIKDITNPKKYLSFKYLPTNK